MSAAELSPQAGKSTATAMRALHIGRYMDAVTFHRKPVKGAATITLPQRAKGANKERRAIATLMCDTRP